LGHNEGEAVVISILIVLQELTLDGLVLKPHILALGRVSLEE
jgi:hypothetical protein